MKKSYNWNRGNPFNYTIYQDGIQLDPVAVIMRLKDADRFGRSTYRLFDALSKLLRFDDHEGLGLDHSFDCDIYDPLGRSTCDCGFDDAIANAKRVLEEEQ